MRATGTRLPGASSLIRIAVAALTSLLLSGCGTLPMLPDRPTSSALQPGNDELLVPTMSLGRLHTKAAVIDESVVYIGSVNLDPRSDSTNTELGMLAECPELARQVIEVIGRSQRGSSYRLRFANDGVAREWLTTTDAGEVVLTQEPEATPLMRLQNVLFGPFVPEQLL